VRDAAASEASDAAGDDDKMRETWSGCECKKTWEKPDVGSCNSYCCNPNQDKDGSWCLVEDTNCEEADWGYCRTSGIGTRTSDANHDAQHCADKPGWSDADGDTCDIYAISSWCTSSGEPSTGWHSEWGTFETFAKNGVGADTACCACGGGVSRNATGDASSIRVMWSVSSGPCRIDITGCAVSGRFPKAYSAWEQCQIAVSEADALPIEVVSFDTEAKFDVLIVNDRSYSGTTGPQGVIPSGTIQWGADSQQEGMGWRLCPRGALNNEAVVELGLRGGSLEGDLLESEVGVGGFSYLKLLIALGLGFVLVATAIWYRRRGKAEYGGGSAIGGTKFGRKYATMDDV
jgi:hypothetical protein